MRSSTRQPQAQRFEEMIRQQPIDPASCLYRHVAATARTLSVAYDRALQPCGLTANQFNLLMSAARSEPVTIGTLAEHLATEPSTLTRLLRPLLDADLLRLERGADRRVKHVCLTAAGHRRLRRALPLWLALQRELVDTVGDESWQRLRASLTTLRRSARARLPA